MRNTLLMPRNFRIAGLIMLVPFIVLFIANFNYDFTFSFLATTPNPADQFQTSMTYNFTDELATAGCLFSLFMIAFSRLKQEDEYIVHIRLRSLQIAVYANYAIFLMLTFGVYGGAYLGVIYFNIASTLILFILVFNYNLHIKPLLTKTAAA